MTILDNWVEDAEVQHDQNLHSEMEKMKLQEDGSKTEKRARSRKLSYIANRPKASLIDRRVLQRVLGYGVYGV